MKLSKIISNLFTNINAPNDKSADTPDVISNNHDSTSEIKLNKPHEVFNPKLSLKPIPRPIYHEYNTNDVFEALIITKKSYYDLFEQNLDTIDDHDVFFYGDQQIILASSYKNFDYDENITTLARLGTFSSPSHKENLDLLWFIIHNAILKMTIQSVKKAIEVGAPAINIAYEYDGVWAYAAGYWSAANYPEAQAYINQLGKLTSKINISFTKFDKSLMYDYVHLIQIANHSY